MQQSIGHDFKVDDTVLPDYGKFQLMWSAAKMYKKTFEAWNTSVRQRVEKDGVLEVKDGTEVRFKNVKTTRADALKAWPIVSKALSKDQLNDSVTLSISKVKKHLYSNGMSKKEVEDLMGELQEADAIQESGYKKIERVAVNEDEVDPEGTKWYK